MTRRASRSGGMEQRMMSGGVSAEAQQQKKFANSLSWREWRMETLFVYGVGL
jgi:hypothetical protein